MPRGLWYILPGIILFGFGIYKAATKPSNKPEVVNVKHGIASKVDFDGHSYVVWQQNWSDCILHDPDCKCGVR